MSQCLFNVYLSLFMHWVAMVEPTNVRTDYHSSERPVWARIRIPTSTDSDRGHRADQILEFRRRVTTEFRRQN